MSRKEESPSWHTTVRKMPHRSGVSYPLLEWSYGFEHGIRGGELRAWPLHGVLTFEDRSGPGPHIAVMRGLVVSEDGRTIEINPDQADKAVQILTEDYGWGKPQHFDQVVEDLIETRSKFPIGGADSGENVETDQGIFTELEKKWEKMISQNCSRNPQG